MPTYEYRCPDGHEFEDFVLKISDAKPELPCPSCGVLAGRRMSAGSGLLFKGSGFYITDYGKDGKKDQRVAAKAGEGSGGTAGDAASKAPAADATPSGSAGAADKPAASKATASKPVASTSAAPSSSAPKSGPAK